MACPFLAKTGSFMKDYHNRSQTGWVSLRTPKKKKKKRSEFQPPTELWHVHQWAVFKPLIRKPIWYWDDLNLINIMNLAVYPCTYPFVKENEKKQELKKKQGPLVLAWCFHTRVRVHGSVVGLSHSCANSVAGVPGTAEADSNCMLRKLAHCVKKVLGNNIC